MSDTKTYSEKLDMATALVSMALGVPIVISTEDRLRGAMVEACMHLRMDAPSRALETLEKALDRKP